MWQVDQLPHFLHDRPAARPLAVFLKKPHVRSNQVVSTIVLICFGRPHCILDCWFRISSISIFYEKGLGLASQKHFAWLFKKNKNPVLFYNWPIFIFWLPLLIELPKNMCIVITWSHRFWRQPQLSYLAVFLHDQKGRDKPL